MQQSSVRLVPTTILASQNNNQYSLLGLLGEGGAGAVYQAIQQSTGQLVALKILHFNGANLSLSDKHSQLKSKRIALRFEREINLCAQLHHPHIVNLIDKGRTHDGKLFAVFEYVPGETLKELLTRKGVLTALETGELMGQVLDALTCAHAQGIAHRDLKPHNIMVSITGARRHVKILDFGIAGLIAQIQRADYRNVTLTQESMCSPAYSAPEQLRGEPATVKMDLYSWGLLFLECLTGQPAISGATVAEIFHQQLSNIEVPIPAALLGHPLAELLRRVLRKNPQERSASASLLYQDFQKINLANIIGSLVTETKNPLLAQQTHSDITQECVPGWFGMSYERQQITVLCCSLSLAIVSPTIAIKKRSNEEEIDILDTLLRDQNSVCVDIARHYGAHVAGAFGNSLMFYFGYPQAAGDDARRAARTALELVSQIRRRSALWINQGIALDYTMGIHTGMVRIVAGHVPTGITPNSAWQLDRQAKPGEVLVSKQARKLLEQFVEFAPERRDLLVNNNSSRETGFNPGHLQCVLLKGEHNSEARLLDGENFAHTMEGREVEWEQIATAWEKAKNGRGHVVLLQGEAGIGKSRLGVELCRVARLQGVQNPVQLREWRCLPEYQNNALYPVLEMLKNQLHVQNANDNDAMVARLQKMLIEAGCDVAATLPIFCSWLSLPIPLGLLAQHFSPERQKHILLEALKNIILFCGSENGTSPIRLVMVEDLHWIDQTSLELLTIIIEACKNNPILLLLTARPNFSASWQSDITHIEVNRLPDPAAHKMIAKMLGGKSIAPTSLTRLTSRADGIPLFIEELTRMLLEDQLLIERDGIYQLEAHFDNSEIPVTLRDLLASRLSRLGAVKDTAQLASVIGREFERSLLAQLSLRDEGTLQADLNYLLAADLIYLQRRVQGDSYIFRHVLIRDAAYESMSPQLLKIAHGRAAKILISDFTDQVDSAAGEIARHCAGAEDFDTAVIYSLKAAAYYYGRSLHQEALHNARQALVWNGKRVDGPVSWEDELSINNIIIPALMVVEGYGDILIEDISNRSMLLAQWLRALSGDEKKSQDNFNHSIQWALTQYQHMRSNRYEARRLAEYLVECARADKNTAYLVESLPLLGLCLATEGAPEAACSAYEEAIALYQFERDKYAMLRNGIDPLVHALTNQAMAQVVQGMRDKADASMAQAKAWAAKIEHLPSIAICHIYDAQVCFLAQGSQLYVMENTQRMFFDLHPEMQFLKNYSQSIFDWNAANSVHQEVFSQFRKSSGQTYLHSLYEAILITTYIKQNNQDKARTRLVEVLNWCSTSGEGAFLGYLYRLQNELNTGEENSVSERLIELQK